MNNRCRHFTGIQNKACEVGVNYREFVGGPDFGWARRLPCLGDDDFHADNKPCSQRSLYTVKELAEQKREAAQHLTVYLKDIEEGRCPVCHQPAKQKQVGPCVYGVPCGHRMYQGRVAKKAMA